MNSTLQKKVLGTLHFSLNDDGYLFLGSSENISIFRPQLEEVDSKWKLYRKTGIARPTDTPRSDDISSDKILRKAEVSRAFPKKASITLIEELKDVLSEEFHCAAIQIDENYDIREATGDFGRYISLQEKKLNLNILKMVPHELSIVLHSALRKLKKENKRVIIRNIKYFSPSGDSVIDLVLKNIIPSDDKPYILIVIKDQKPPVLSEAYQPARIIEGNASTLDYVQELEQEIKETRLSLQIAVEGLETANEELQSSNEELLSANEELQSSNEELQSLNEELHTLNTEHQIKIKELVELNDDLNNYFRTTDIGQIFIDRRLHIRKFNPAAVKLINLIESDIGRPFSHISTNIRYDGLLKDVEDVISNSIIIEKEVQLSNMKVSLMRILPYVRQDKQIDGVVMTFVDISTIKNLDNIIKGVFNLSQSSIMVLKSIRDNEEKIRDLQWIALNTASVKLLNGAHEEYIGKNISQEAPELLNDSLFARYKAVIETGANLRFEKQFKLKNSDCWYDVIAAKLGDGIIITFTDISEKKESEERLKKNYNELVGVRENLKNLNVQLEDKISERTRKLAESEERFRLVSMATNDAIWDWNLVKNEIWWNENFYQITGYDSSLSFNRSEWLEKIHPSDRQLVNESLSNTINKGEKQWTIEYRFLRADDSYARILDRGYLLMDEYHTPYRMLGSMLDVTQLRSAEEAAIHNIEQRKFLAESMPLIVWTANIKGEVDFLNQQFMLVTGLSIEQGLGRGWESIIHPEDLGRLRIVWKSAFRNKRDFSMELRLRKFDDEYRWYLLRARARKDEFDRLALWVGSNTDIHEQKLINETLEKRVRDRTSELHRMNDELESSNIELQQFAFVASHDLKEPLRKINMFSLIVKDKYLKEADQQAAYLLDRIVSSSTRMTKLVNDLLDFSRLSITQLFEPTDLNVVINEILSDLELIINEKQAEINFRALPTIQAVPAQMRQVFQNIISNAIKFSNKDVDPVINISSTIIDEKNFDAPVVKNGRYCRIYIKDNGIGFEEQYAAKIFTIFQRLHTKESYEGTGIGLAITKKIIERHNGIIQAESAINEGSTFTIILPIEHSIPPSK